MNATTKDWFNEEIHDEQLLKTMVINRKTPKTDKQKVLDTLNKILNGKQEENGK